jgi:amino acid transporter
MKAKLLTSAVLTLAFTAAAYADIPPPKEAPPTDWSFVLMGVISAFLGGMLFVWLGRRLFKRSQ